MSFPSFRKFVRIFLLISILISLALIIPGAIMCSRITYCTVPAIVDEANNYYCGFQCCPGYECNQNTLSTWNQNSVTCLLGNETTTHCCQFCQDAVGYNVCILCTIFGGSLLIGVICFSPLLLI